MVAKPMTSEAIALAEKKMDMTLDDIIKMSKNNVRKAKKQQRRAPTKGWSFKKNAAQDKSMKVKQFMDSRSSFRQGVLTKRRTNFCGNHSNQFPLPAEVARKAAAAPLRNRPFRFNKVANWKSRVDTPSGQRRAWKAGFVAKPPRQQQQQINSIPNQRPRTLDSLFANIQEQRMKNNNVQRNRNGQQMPPWGRSRFGNRSVHQFVSAR